MCLMLMLAAFRDQSKNSQGKYSLNGIETSVYVRMALYASEDGRNIYPSLNTLVAELKYSKRAIQRSIKSLLAKERIILVKESIRGLHRANEYKINLKLLPKQVTVKSPAYDAPVDNFVDNSPFSVDKPVDNLWITTPPIAPETIGAIATDAIPPIATNAPYNHKNNHIKNHLMIRQQLLQNINNLVRMDVHPRLAQRWIREFGDKTLSKVILAMENIERQKGVKIRNKGAYIKKILEQQKEKDQL